MRWLASALICAALFAAGAGDAAKTKKPPKGHFGSEWVGADGDMRRPSLHLWVEPPRDDAAIYRAAQYDWKRSSIQVGPYPAAALKADQEGVVDLKLMVDAMGKPTDCHIIKGSGVAELDAHACPQLLRHAQFYPALGSDGQRIGREVSVSLSYILKLYVSVPAMTNFADQPRKPALPLNPITLETIGITDAHKAKIDNYAIAADVAIGADANPTSCLLTAPTLDDAIDAMVCDRLMQLGYKAASKWNGEAVADIVRVSLPLRQR